ncbi:MAG TPA: hypothetical protein VN493_21130 [Thermoanaerobaculia bacterium]|nr:hypothetical protein [Thermoanaerobaculia bacterium]
MILLDEWLSQQLITNFPQRGKVNYSQRFLSVAEYLNNYVHPEIGKLAIVRHDGFLTDHGPEHVKTVIQRASELIGDPTGKLSAYEVYLLLMACHFHDVGNIFGRGEHEKKLGPIMAKVGTLLGDDAVEIHAIQKIAAAHGGSIDGNKDTISYLPVSDPVLGNKVHMQQLAAVLRFADELADDYSRASRFLLDIDQVPKESEVFHMYAAHLHSVVVDSESSSVNLHFSFNKDVAVEKFGKRDSEVFLLNEIYERTMKMHLERMYCSRFMSKIVRIDAVKVRIEVYPSNHSPALLHAIGYRLEERGYPQAAEADINSLCPDLEWTGETLCEDLLSKSEVS